MQSDVASYRLSRWGQVFVLVLAGAVLMQGMPVQALLEAGSTCVFEERGFCPRNPDGPCQCEHHHHSSSERASATGEKEARTFDDSDAHAPTLQACEGNQPTAIGSMFPTRWLVPGGVPMTRPASSAVSYETASRLLSPQQVGDDVFHPPRPAAA